MDSCVSLSRALPALLVNPRRKDLPAEDELFQTDDLFGTCGADACREMRAVDIDDAMQLGQERQQRGRAGRHGGHAHAGERRAERASELSVLS